MPFMKPQVYETDYLEIDGPQGTEIIPCDVVDYRPTKEQTSERLGAHRLAIPSELADYCQNREAFTIDRKHGWIGRLSAPGYMDRTDWTHGESEDEVRAELARMYGDE